MADKLRILMNSVDAKTLQQLKNLAGFSAAHLEKLADNLSVETAKKNEVVFDQGDDAKLVYLLLSGVVKLSFISNHERETIVSLLPAGRFFWSRFAYPASALCFKVRSV
jgi:CRP-like cAMP-binding protein